MTTRVTTFYSYKGGLGRSLLLAWSATELARQGRRVVAIDLDLEAPGLGFKLGLDDPTSTGPGVVDLLQDFLEGQPPPSSLAELCHPVGSSGHLWLLPAGAAPSPTYWRTLAGVSWEALFYGPDPQGVHFFTWLKETLIDELSPDHILVDARTGVTDLGGAALSLLADQVLALVGTSREGLVGTRSVLRALTASASDAQETPPRLGAVLSRVPGSLPASDLRVLRDEIHAFLSADADRLAATIDLDRPIVVRSEPRLQVEERDALTGSSLRVVEDYEQVLAWIEGAPAGDVPDALPGVDLAPIQAMETAVALLRERASDDPQHHVDLARLLDNQAHRLTRAGQHEKGLALAEQAVAILREVQQASPQVFDGELAMLLATLAEALAATGRYADAIRVLQEELVIHQQLGNPQQVAMTLAILASLCERAGTTHDALPLVPQGLALLDGPQGQDPALLRNLELFGRFLHSMGHAPAARQVHEAVLQARRDVLGPEHPDTLESMNYVATSRADCGELDQARALIEASLATRERTLGPHHPDTLTSQNNLAATLAKLGDHRRAHDLHEATLAARTEVLGPEHPDTLASMHNLATAKWVLGDHPGATALNKQVLHIRERTQGPHHPATWISKQNLAVALHRAGEHRQAQALWRDILATAQRVVGREHPQTTIAAWRLHQSLVATGDHEEAREVFDQHLRWLSTQDPLHLGAEQRVIRDQVRAIQASSDSPTD